ncbi:MAG TPA: hypothetical protein VEL48_10550 [Candidatus Acidoferrales bacterium]|nr:hypothetical protein [Candidatus Acidoferrales bacterium]
MAREGVRAITPFLNPSTPSAARQAMRKLGITRVTVRMMDDGSFEFDGHRPQQAGWDK